MSVPNPATTPWIPLWDTGASGPPKSPSIPGEIKLWGGKVLPLLADYGLWVWADGTAYSATLYPKAASHIAPEWKTHDGKADPGAGQFRVPDLRGQTPVGLDAMPGGSRANRIVRAVAIVVAAKTGEETHIVSVAEMPSHSHVVNSHAHGGGNHAHTIWGPGGGGSTQPGTGYGQPLTFDQGSGYSGNTIGAEAPGTDARGSGTAHETMQPSVFVPYIVALDS